MYLYREVNVGDKCRHPEYGCGCPQIYTDPTLDDSLFYNDVYLNGYVPAHTDGYNYLSIMVMDCVDGLYLVHREDGKLVSTPVKKHCEYKFRARVLHGLYPKHMADMIVERQTFKFKECMDFDKSLDTTFNETYLIKFRFKK